MEVKLFVREDCPDCPAARRACEGISNVSVYDVGDLQGMAEASEFGVQAVPSVVVIDSSGREVAGWRGETPDAAELRAILAN
ncbi:MAG: thioredoxin family protein [Coriobacteriia bacterium]|nr:thioredoxin family protein [Coriobacteriia bacterium]